MKRAWLFFFLVLVLRLPAQQVHFTAFDIFVDSKDVPLAAYQLEFSGPADKVRITGIEGGEHEAFRIPPFYDPKAIQQERVILAAFSSAAAAKLPTGRTRVATVHVQFTGQRMPDFSVAAQTAANVEGESISVQTTFKQRASYE